MNDAIVGRRDQECVEGTGIVSDVGTLAQHKFSTICRKHYDASGLDLKAFPNFLRNRNLKLMAQLAGAEDLSGQSEQRK